MVKVKEDLTGRIFGLLTVIEQVEDYIQPNGRHVAMWKCKCACKEHNIVRVLGDSLNRGNNKEDAIKTRLIAEKKLYKEFAPQQHLFDQYGIKEIQNDRK